MACHREGGPLVDQHVAHERILYERSLRDMESEPSPHMQRLLHPIILELNPQQKAVADSLLKLLNANGFEVDWFGRSILAVKGIPSLARHCDAEQSIHPVLTDLEELLEGGENGENSDSRLRCLREKNCRQPFLPCRHQNQHAPQ